MKKIFNVSILSGGEAMMKIMESFPEYKKNIVVAVVKKILPM